jgi:dolichol-phosphate mannosyltransferase
MRAVVVIPTYNERDNVMPLLDLIWKHAAELHVLIVDDHSPDGTGEVAQRASERWPDRVFTLHRASKSGLGAAYRHGFRHVLSLGYDAILQMDADLSHDPAELPGLLDALKNADLVLGSRYLGGIRVINWDFKRLLLSKAATRFTQIVTGVPLTDLTGGFKAWRREALEAIDLDAIPARGYLFQIETTFQAYQKGFRVAELPIVFHERRLGQSKIDYRIILEAAIGVLRLGLTARIRPAARNHSGSKS